ncbi:MAG: T9SS type A sorting domain-containing protein [Bacteroidia bacterium]
MKNKLLLALLALCFVSGSFAQDWKLSNDHIFHQGNNASDQAFKILEAENGNKIAVGEISVMSLNDFSINGSQHKTIGPGSYIVKLDTAGQIIWSRSINGNSTITDLTVDRKGNIAVSAIYNGNIYINSQDTTIRYFKDKKSYDAKGSFVISFDKNGKFLWSNNIASISEVFIDKVGFGKDNSVIVVGSYLNRINLNPKGDPKYLERQEAPVFMAHYDKDGLLIKARSIKSDSWIQVQSLSIDNDYNIILGAYFNGDINLEAINKNKDFLGDGKTVVIKFNENLNPIWGIRLKTSKSFTFNACKVDLNQNIYLAGAFFSSVAFDPDNNRDFTTHKGYGDAFVVKYDSSGNFKNLLSFGSSSINTVVDLSLGSGSSMYITGSTEGATDFNPSANDTTMVTSQYGTYFVAKYVGFEKLMWVKHSEIDRNWLETAALCVNANTSAIWTIGTNTWPHSNTCFSVYDSTGELKSRWIQDNAYSIIETADMGVSSHGNTVVVGKFLGLKTYVNSDGEVDTFLTDNYYNGFVLMLDSNLNYKWLTQIKFKEYSKIIAVTIDDSNNIFITGEFQDTIVFEIGNLKSVHYNKGRKMFLTKYSALGKYRWSKTVGANSPIFPYAMDYNAVTNSVIVGGKFQDSVSCIVNSKMVSALSSGADDAILLSFNQADGALMYFNTFGGEDDDQIDLVECNKNGRVFLANTIDSKNFNFKRNGVNQSSEDLLQANNVCFTLLNTKGELMWNRVFSKRNIYNVRVTAISSIDSTNAFAMNFNGRFEFQEKGKDYDFKSKAVTQNDALIGFISNSNQIKNIISLGSNQNNSISTITGLNGTFQMICNFRDEISLSDFSFNKLQPRSKGDTSEILFLSFNQSGKLLRKHHLPFQCNISKLIVSQNRINLLGTFSNGIPSSFGWTQDNNYRIPSSRWSPFVSTYNLKRPCLPYIDSANISSCNYFIDDNGIKYTSDTILVDTFKTRFSCDSLVYKTIDITNINASIFSDGNMLKSKQENVEFQWLDCANNYKAIAGEIKSSFAPNKSGDYAVVITKDGCSDTSNCINFIHSGVKGAINSTINIYPNPTSKNAIVVSSKENYPLKINVLDALGNHAVTYNNVLTKQQLIALPPAAGIYIIEIESATETIYKKVLKLK